jgi:hypothetical protein
LVAGYLRGVAARGGTLPHDWAQRLDRAAERHPDYAAFLTLQADTSPEGFRRVLGLVKSRAVPPDCLAGFTSPLWDRVLGAADKAQVFQTLLRLEDRDPHPVCTAGLILAAAWAGYGRQPLPPELVSPVLRLLRRGLEFRNDVTEWSTALEALAATHPAEAADVAAEALTSNGPLRVAAEEPALTVLRTLAGKHPAEVMEAVGKCLLDPERRYYFGLCRCPGLFEAIGLPAVRAWVTRHGDEVVKDIARHLDSPRLQDRQPVVPPVTEWVLSAYENEDSVFREFCLGRHNGEIRVGPARDRRPELEKSLQPFQTHPLRRVREWAQYELKENERDIALDDYLDDRQERE